MIDVFHHSEPGGHPHNEDAFEIRALPPELGAYLCVIADGQGGQPGGGEAARLACRVCADTAARLEPAALLLPTTWTTILSTVDRAVADEPTAGYTTVVAFAVTGSRVCGASCGDSAAVLFQGGDPMVILTDGQQKNPPVGSGFATFVSFAANLVLPWLVLAMSDGVWKYAGWERIAKAASERRGERLITSLLKLTRLRSGALQDDFTLIGFASDDGTLLSV